METLRGFPVFVSWDLRHFVILPCKTVHLSTEKMYVRRAMVNSKKVQTVLYKKESRSKSMGQSTAEQQPYKDTGENTLLDTPGSCR